MKADGLFVITAIIFIFVAWVATGGPTRPIARQGPFITPVTRSGEESQGYRGLAPTNPINSGSYPRQIGGATATISKGDAYTRTSDSSSGSSVYIERSSVGPHTTDPNREYISIVNSGFATTTAAGWTLTSKSSGASATIPPFTLLPRAKITIVTGTASQNGVCSVGASCISLGQSQELYASSTETIILKNGTGSLVDTYSY